MTWRLGPRGYYINNQPSLYFTMSWMRRELIYGRIYMFLLLETQNGPKSPKPPAGHGRYCWLRTTLGLGKTGKLIFAICNLVLYSLFHFQIKNTTFFWTIKMSPSRLLPTKSHGFLRWRWYVVLIFKIFRVN